MAAPPRPPTTAPAIGAPTVEPTTAPAPAPMAPPVSARSVGLLPQAAVIRPRDTIAATGMKVLNDISCLLFVNRLPCASGISKRRNALRLRGFPQKKQCLPKGSSRTQRLQHNVVAPANSLCSFSRRAHIENGTQAAGER